MVNGISVNGLGEVAMDTSQTASNLIGLGKQLSHELLLGNQPNIHPGSITSTGRQRVGTGTATSTQAAQLIGGGISPTLFTSPQTHQLVVGNTSHYPVNNSLMIGDYVTPASTVLGAQTYRQ
jgi:histone-arginine methyltransferase CARM1